jgi:hypothetical protein
MVKYDNLYIKGPTGRSETTLLVVFSKRPGQIDRRCFKNNPEVVGTPISQNGARMVLVVVSPKRAGVVPEVVLRNALRTGSEVVSENEPPPFSRSLMESAGSRRLPRVFIFEVICKRRRNTAAQ